MKTRAEELAEGLERAVWRPELVVCTPGEKLLLEQRLKVLAEPRVVVSDFRDKVGTRRIQFSLVQAPLGTPAESDPQWITIEPPNPTTRADGNSVKAPAKRKRKKPEV